jgi:mono/diheme cytochrome c family protein
MERASNVRKNHKIAQLFLVALVFVIAKPAMAQTGNATNGQTIFEDKCVRCHNKDGSGDTVVGKALKAMDLRSADVQKKSDADFYIQIDKGKGNMPPFGGGLDKAQINDLVAYVRQFGKKQTAGKKH